MTTDKVDLDTAPEAIATALALFYNDTDSEDRPSVEKYEQEARAIMDFIGWPAICAELTAAREVVEAAEALQIFTEDYRLDPDEILLAAALATYRAETTASTSSGETGDK